MLKVWGRRSAFNVQKVLWLVDELGLAHEHVPLGGTHGGLDAPGFLAMNPNGRVPVIEEDGAVVWESHAILRYLAARHGGEAFWPADPAARALADRWTDWALASLQPAFMDLFASFYRTPEERRDPARVADALARCAALYGILDRQLHGRDYLAGDRLTLADIPAGTSLYRYFTLAIERPSLPNVEALYRRLAARPAYAKNVMVPYEALARGQGS
jgi:glutathione S-transferase